MTSQKFKFVKLWDRLVYLERTRWKKNPCQIDEPLVQIDGEIEAPLSKDTHPSKIGLNRKNYDLHGFMTTVQLYTGYITLNMVAFV